MHEEVSVIDSYQNPLSHLTKGQRDKLLHLADEAEAAAADAYKMKLEYWLADWDRALAHPSSADSNKPDIFSQMRSIFEKFKNRGLWNAFEQIPAPILESLFKHQLENLVAIDKSTAELNQAHWEESSRRGGGRTEVADLLEPHKELMISLEAVFGDLRHSEHAFVNNSEVIAWAFWSDQVKITPAQTANLLEKGFRPATSTYQRREQVCWVKEK
jgi:hypothetical protein